MYEGVLFLCFPELWLMVVLISRLHRSTGSWRWHIWARAQLIQHMLPWDTPRALEMVEESNGCIQLGPASLEGERYMYM